MTFGDRIYNWRDSQLSIARFYGGITIQGVRYTLDFTDPDMPLIRDGVKTREQERKASDAEYRRDQSVRAIKAQGVLI